MQLSVALKDVMGERHRQEIKFPDQHLPDGTYHGYNECITRERHKLDTEFSVRAGCLTWKTVLQEEVSEAFAEEDVDALRAELVQVAAVAVRWIEDLDRAATL